MALTLAAHGSTATGGAASFTSNNVSVTAGEMYVVTLNLGSEDGTDPETFLSGTLAGIALSQRGHSPYDVGAGTFRNRGYVMTMAATATTAGPLIINLSASETRVTWTITKVSGTGGSVQFIQAATGNATSQTASATLAAFAQTANFNFTFVGCQVGSAPTITQEAGGTALFGPVSSNQNHSYASYKQNDVTFQQGLSVSINWGCVALELADGKTLSLGGSITPTGTLAKTTTKTLAGSITPTGTLDTLITRVLLLAGSITPVGTLAKTVTKTLGGSITPTGTLTIELLKRFLYPLVEGALTLIQKTTDTLHLTSRAEDTLELDPLEEDDR